MTAIDTGARELGHNHQQKPYGALAAPGDCGRCDQIRAERASAGIVDHNHAPLPFGRRLPESQCPRCDELHAGAPARDLGSSRGDSRPAGPQHNHQQKPYGALAAPGDCGRCDQIRAERASAGIVDHNHAPLPFGRRLPESQCPRCDELHAGAEPRPGWRRKSPGPCADCGAPREPGNFGRFCAICDIKHHDCVASNCSVVCTYGDW